MTAAHDQMAQFGNVELGALTEVVALPDQFRSLADACKFAMQLIAIAEAQKIGRGFGMQAGKQACQRDEQGADHFS